MIVFIVDDPGGASDLKIVRGPVAKRIWHRRRLGGRCAWGKRQRDPRERQQERTAREARHGNTEIQFRAGDSLHE